MMAVLGEYMAQLIDKECKDADGENHQYSDGKCHAYYDLYKLTQEMYNE